MLFQIGQRYKKFFIKIVGITESDKIKDWIYEDEENNLWDSIIS